MKKTLSVCICAIAISGQLVSCSRQNAEIVNQAGNELVMCPGSSIEVAAADRSLSIHAVGKLKRRYRISGIDETAALIPRKSRWNGSFGAYRPAGVGDLHLILEESLLFFDTEEDLYYWLSWKKGFGGQFYYTSDGLVVSWSIMVRASNPKSSDRALRVDVHQLLLKGEKPRNLTGAQNEAIRISNSSMDCTIGDHRNARFIASPSKVIGGRRYSGWAIDIMRAHDITPEMVELALSGHNLTVRDGYRTYFYYPKSGSEWLKAFHVTFDSAGSVVFLYK